MKIGIITYHRSYNYGALLQAIALRKVLSDMGHEVTFIDYWPAYHRNVYALFSFHWLLSRRGVKGKFEYLISCIINWTWRKKRKDHFEKFIAEYIDPFTSSVDEIYDVIVHGSDQIWRKQPIINKYNPVYFGKHQIRTRKRLSYAASMGILPEKDSDKQEIKSLLSNLDYISVREQNLLDLVKSLGYSVAHQDIDPTLLLPSDDWVNMFNLKKKSGEKYAIYYKMKNSFDISQLQKFASAKGLNLKIIYSKAIGQETDSDITTANPIQFLELLYNADFVFTSSFHGLAFSLLFHKPFLASFTNNGERAVSLLQSLDLSEYLILPKVEIPAQINEINYDRVESKLFLLRTSSMNYLESVVV